MTVLKTAVIGAGPAGLAAAEALLKNGFLVDIFEKENFLRGHTAQYCCKASDRCLSCGVCHVERLAADISNHADINIHLNSKVESFEKKHDAYQLLVNQSGKPGRFPGYLFVIFTTGFLPYDPKLKPALQFGRHPDILRADEFEKLLLTSQRPVRPSNGEPVRRIAFLLCTGSRDRHYGTDYCSRVCCVYSLRIAHHLAFHYPELEIFVFYIDLQNPSKHIHELTQKLPEQIRLISSAPATIRLHTDSRLEICHDDASMNQIRKTLFDIVVLSTGMLPNHPGEIPAGPIPMECNPWGFLLPDQPLTGITAAGSATGPLTIMESIRHAREQVQHLIDQHSGRSGLEIPSEDKS